MISSFKSWVYQKRLKKQKIKAWFEVGSDIRYLEEFKGDMLGYDEGPARKRMAELKKKEDKITQTEQQELEAILNTISESKAVKNEHQKCTILLKDLENYISIL